MTTLAEQLVLLALDERSGRIKAAASPGLDAGIAGAWLLELTLAGRVAVDAETVRVRSATPTGQPTLDEALAEIAGDGEHSARAWIRRFGKRSARERVLADLTERGMVRAQKGKVLGLLPTTSHPEVQGGEERTIRERLRTAFLGEGSRDDETMALAALVEGVGLTREVFGGDARAAGRRIRDAAEDPVAAGVSAQITGAAAAVLVTLGTTVYTGVTGTGT
jgi:hypothetical protein